MTATFQITRDLGWEYLEKLAKQKIMQVQSSTDPPKKLALGERAVMADGNEYNALQLKEEGKPVEIVYPTEGTPLVGRARTRSSRTRRTRTPRGCCRATVHAGVPAAHASMSAGCARCIRRPRKSPGRKPLKESRLMKDDAAGVEKQRRADQGALLARSSACEVSRFVKQTPFIPAQAGIQIWPLGPRLARGRTGKESEMKSKFTRRDVLKGTGARAPSLASTRVLSPAPAATPSRRR